MEDFRTRFQELLRQMFQFDCSDLDFGIYRIMNFKREAIEQFIKKDLVGAISKELSSGILASDARAAIELEDLAENIREALGEAALDGDGVLSDQFHGTPLGKRYLDIQARASGALAKPALEAAVFNHLYAFFNRYYDAGDFLSKRRYSRKEKYAIPYNGEEVHLHWANSDQYYIKTGEYFTDYRFSSRSITVHFRLRQADVPQNNVKGDKRLFVPLSKEATFCSVPVVRSVPVRASQETPPCPVGDGVTTNGETVRSVPVRASQETPHGVTTNGETVRSVPVRASQETPHGVTTNGETPHGVTTSEIVIPFEFRPLTDAEQTRYAQRNQQDAIIAEAAKELLDSIGQGKMGTGTGQTAARSQFPSSNDALAALLAVHHKTADGKDVTFLAHHLRQYTQKNTSDFFIHKDLKGFLARELDFYLKNEVLNLDDLEAAGETRSAGWFQLMRAIKSIGGRIIEFLAQIEDFQKMLFEKRKFITDTWYCITVGNIAEDFHADIAANDDQWTQWKDLFHIDEEQKNLFNSAAKNRKDRRAAFLKAHPTLVLDTRNFDADFVDRLLASFDDLDEMTDGLLVHSENFQALGLLQEKYRQQVKCIHIDPPYNTQTSGFLYKNDYQHSSWLAMMQNRVAAGIPLLSGEGAYLCHIDENEYEFLHVMFGGLGIPDGGTIIWDKKNPMLGRKRIATQHEYVLWRTWQDSPVYVKPTNVLLIIDNAQAIIQKHGGVNEEARREFSTWVAKCEGLTGGDKAYRLLDDDGRIYQSVAMGAPEQRTDPKYHVALVHPETKKECPVPSNGWSRTPENLQNLVSRGEIIFGEDEATQPRKKVFLTNGSKRQLSSVVSDSSRGKLDVDKLGVEFPYCHPVSLYEELLGAGAPGEGDVVLDFFAGSGTNGHAVISLNREDGLRRRFILVEMGEYFDTVLLPRIKKVTFTPEWKDGRPVRQATAEEAERSPRIVKVIRLESYEDALNNIMFTGVPKGLYDFDDYMLQYMLRWETKESATLLNVEQLASPFAYKLRVRSVPVVRSVHVWALGESQETPHGVTTNEEQEKVVDVPETFAYLLGLHVKTRRVYVCSVPVRASGESQETPPRPVGDGVTTNKYVVYRGAIDHREVVVIWRDCAGWEKADFERDKKFAADQKLAEGADEVFVNGDSLIPGARSLDGVFKARMFGS